MDYESQRFKFLDFTLEKSLSSYKNWRKNSRNKKFLRFSQTNDVGWGISCWRKKKTFFTTFWHFITFLFFSHKNKGKDFLLFLPQTYLDTPMRHCKTGRVHDLRSKHYANLTSSQSPYWFFFSLSFLAAILIKK